MADMENVIGNIEQQIRWIEEIECHKFPGWLNVTNAMRDALALLKEHGQEPVKPVKTYAIPMYVQMNYECGNCRAPMFREQPYCMKCGKKMKWE